MEACVGAEDLLSVCLCYDAKIGDRMFAFWGVL